MKIEVSLRSITAVSMIVLLGILFGALAYIISNNTRIDLPITISPKPAEQKAAEQYMKDRAEMILKLNNVEKYSLKSLEKSKVKLPEQIEISKAILIKSFPDFAKYADNDVWQAGFSGEIKELEYSVIFDPNGKNVIAAFKNDKRAVPGIEPFKLEISLPEVDNREAFLEEDFLITLPANPSTGYSWEAKFDEKYVALRSKDFVADKVSGPEAVGKGGTEVFTFIPAAAGETMITMSYVRSWENKPAEIKVFKYDIKEKANAADSMEFQSLMKNDISKHNDKKQYVITTSKDWLDLISKYDLPALPPEDSIDFDKEMIIAVFQGKQPTGGYGIEINRITEKESAIEVSVFETSPGLKCMVTKALTSPYHMIKIAKQLKEIKFNLVERYNNCESYSQ